MLRRAIIRVFFALAGSSMAFATPLNPERNNMTFQPGTGASLTKPTVLKVGSSTRWDRTPVWSGVKVRKIIPGLQTTAPVEVGGITFRQSHEAAAPKPTVQSAGGRR